MRNISLDQFDASRPPRVSELWFAAQLRPKEAHLQLRRDWLEEMECDGGRCVDEIGCQK